ncbi:MAG TPA: hypothetical protein DD637_01890 [Verrucomicrobia bacterium]|nr:hypothetical protein [Verrucomicrobiota bacterium]
MAIWIIAVLAVIVVSFVYEARQQSGVNLYVLSRNRVDRFVDAGRILAEVVLTGYGSAPDWSEDQDTPKLLEDDRWVVEKQELKSASRCTIGPIVLDADDPESGTVKVEISTVNSGTEGIIDINELCKSGDDTKYMERWWMIFKAHNIPEELNTPRDGVVNLWNILIASWDDWRDEDDNVTIIDGAECGAENKWYEELEEKFTGTDDEKNELKRRPRQGRIPDVKELEYVRGFRDYPQVLTGGVINPWEREEDQIAVRGILNLFCTEGGKKINVNTCDNVDALVTVPGVYSNPEEDEALADAQELARAIVQARGVPPETYDVDETRTSWPFKDFADLRTRLALVPMDATLDIGAEASEYFSFSAGKDTIYKITITGESGGMAHTVEAEAYAKDSKVRYIRWRED